MCGTEDDVTRHRRASKKEIAMMRKIKRPDFLELIGGSYSLIVRELALDDLNHLLSVDEIRVWHHFPIVMQVAQALQYCVQPT
ncbi:MAG: hypothetical protein MMC33_000030 [Icmadophila ericetorum]|nr:hypothetical protein [Icmadophila ericetorum]